MNAVENCIIILYYYNESHQSDITTELVTAHVFTVWVPKVSLRSLARLAIQKTRKQLS